MGDDRPARYVEPTPFELINDDDRPEQTVVYRASQLGVCDVHILSVSQGFLGAPMPQWFRDVLDEGSLCEGDIATMWEEKMEIPTINAQAECELDLGDMFGHRVIVRGHIDGEADHVPFGDTENVGREFKKFRESTWDNFLSKGIEVNKNYPWQASVYWHARGWSHLEFVGGHIAGYRCPNGSYCTPCMKGKLHDKPYDDNADELTPTRIPVIGEVQCKRITLPPIPLKDIRKRILRWERMIDSGMVAADVDCQKPFAYPCPFYTLHPEDDEPETFKVPTGHAAGGAIKRIHGTTRRLTELAAEMRRLGEERKRDQAELKEHLAALGEDADSAKFITYGSLSLTRTRSHVNEKTIRAYDTDNFAATKEPDLSAKPGGKPAAKKAAPKKAAAKKAAAKRTRVGGAQ